MIDHIKTLVLYNKKISKNVYLLGFKIDKKIDIKPGQFLMIRGWDSLDPLNNRAFAIANAYDNIVEIGFDIKGRGTAILSNLKEKEELSILMPLGKGVFNTKDKKHVVIGGGIGITALTLLIKELNKKNKEVHVFYGVKNKDQLISLDWLQSFTKEINIYTEDGSIGKKGFVTECINEFDNSYVFHVCGPTGMLKTVQKISEKKNLKIYISLETPMACGWGVCLGCVVKDKEGKFIRTCKEGPVFESSSVHL